jgi:glutamyl-tRNA reductase
MEDSRFPSPDLWCIGASHKTAPLGFRERVFVDSNTLLLQLAALKESCAIDEVLVLSTCNRFEIYGVSAPESIVPAILERVFVRLQNLAGKTQPLTPDELSTHLYTHHDMGAVHHLMAVACSLDSMVVGETQITGQFKTALNIASQAGSLGPILSRLGQEALATVKKVRSQTAIGEKTVSISHAAIELAKRVFHSLGDQCMVVIGAGEMATVAALYAASFKPRRFYVVNRTLAKAETLVSRVGKGQAMPLSKLSEVLREADIVISASSAPETLISREVLQQVMDERQHRLLYLVDIAIPRDIDPLCASLENVYHFDIDDLQKLVDEHRAMRSSAAEEARVIIQRSAELFYQWLLEAPLKPALEGFHQYLDDLLCRELARTLTGKRYRELSTEQIWGIKKMLEAVAKKIVGDAALSLHEHAGLRPQQEQLLTALNLLFAPHFPKKTYSLQQRKLHAALSSSTTSASLGHRLTGQ